MKKFTFFIVLLGLALAAFLTRSHDPKADFTNYWVQKRTAATSNPVARAVNDLQAHAFADQCEYKDRYLWVDVKNGGQTVFTNAYGRWFNRAEVKEVVEQKLEQARDKVKSEVDSLENGRDAVKDGVQQVAPATREN